MKKIVSFSLSLLILLTFCSCGKGKNESTPQGVTINIEETKKPEATKEEKSENKTIKIKLPVELIEEKYRDNLDVYCSSYGYESAKLNKDGTVTIKMSALTHSLLLTRMGMTVMSQIGSVLDSGDYPYFKDIGVYNEDFSYIVLLVDGKEYKEESTSNFLPYVVSEFCMYYQLYTTRDNYQCEVVIADEKTKEVVYSNIYTSENPEQ